MFFTKSKKEHRLQQLKKARSGLPHNALHSLVMTCFHSSILCMYILHTRDTVCDDQPSSLTTGHDFAKSSRRAHSGLFIVVTNGEALICLLCSTMQLDMIVKKKNMLIFFCRVYSEREGCYHPSSCFPTHCTQTVANFMSRNWTMQLDMIVINTIIFYVNQTDRYG